MTAKNVSPPLHVVWFKRDLRVDDNRALAHAAARGLVLPLFVVEPDLWRQPDMSGRHWSFVRECLEELRRSLSAIGQPLVVRIGAVTDILDEILSGHGVAALWSHQETGNAWTFARDLRVADWCRRHAVPWHEERQSGVVRRLGGRNGWALRWDRFMAEEVTPAPRQLAPLTGFEPGNMPSPRQLEMAPDPCPGRQTGGRASGLSNLDSFLSDRGETYRTAMSSPLLGEQACSRLSPHLAWGTVSTREVAHATWSRQREIKAAPKGTTGAWRGALISFSGRLHWRCHFMQKLEDEPRLEFENLHAAYDGLRPSQPDRMRLDAWINGETGLPFVDACMRALTAAGWLNFRMRAMVMAVASYHLWLDWRQPGEHLARVFTDYEPGIHWPQVQMQSGTTGINTVRIYNPVKQGYDNDPGGAFVRRWVPELAQVPDAFVHEPWKWSGASSVLGRRYPFPILDHLAAATEARRRVWSVRKGAVFRDEAARIQHKHGSRKSGIRGAGRKPVIKAADSQLALSLSPKGVP